MNPATPPSFYVNTTSPRVSVLLPTYNRARFLEEAIDSVLRQTLEDLELIVVDDGSSDETPALLAAIEDPRLRCTRQPHSGISATLNRALSAARGEYIARLDSDDLWLPNMLATLVPILDLRRDAGVAYAQGQAMTADGHPLAHVQGLPPRFANDSLRSIVYDDCTCNIALIARRSCFERVGTYDKNLIANEDWDMWLRVARQFDFVFVEQVVARIRWHDGNLTGPGSADFTAVLDARTRPLDKLFAEPDLPAAVRAMRPIAYTNVYLYRAQRFVRSGQYRRAIGELRSALTSGPGIVSPLLRFVWLAGFAEILKRDAIGRRVLSTLADIRRRRRVIRDRRATLRALDSPAAIDEAGRESNSAENDAGSGV